MPLAAEYQVMFDELAKEPAPPMSSMTPAQGREMYRMMRAVNPDLAVASVADRTIDGPAGAIDVRIYTPAGDGPFPVLVNYHGGGWVIGDLDTSDAACRDIANTVGCVVVSVDYRLAPEHVFPAAVDDSYAAACWAAENMSALNGNGKLAVGGESAGGNLAAVVALKARDENGPAIAAQLLLYPVVDADLTRGSYSENGEGYLLTTDTMAWFWDHYCPDQSQRADPQASPIHAANHANLPPAIIATAEFDPLRDEGAAYASKLEAAGVPVHHQCFDGLVHDFFATAQVFPTSRAAFEATCAALKKQL